MIDSKPDFESIFKSQFATLCNIAFNITKNKKAAEDIVQDIFLKLWKNKHRIEAIDNYKGYLYRSVTNASIDYLKQNKNTIPVAAQREIVSPASNGEKQMMEKELAVKIEKALLSLPPKCRAIFVLSRHEGMKYREIAEYLEISVKTVENQMGIALGKLREELKPYLTREFNSYSAPTIKTGT
jgi:RNA polymerase sigma-70 factor, ECF subfamily